MNCQNCGAVIPDNSTECPLCGAIVQQGYQQPYQQQGYQQPYEEEKATTGFKILSFLIPIAGLVLYLTKKDTAPTAAKEYGKMALISVIIGVVLNIISGIISAVD